jgi:hypothetical protein
MKNVLLTVILASVFALVLGGGQAAAATCMSDDPACGGGSPPPPPPSEPEPEPDPGSGDNYDDVNAPGVEGEEEFSATYSRPSWYESYDAARGGCYTAQWKDNAGRFIYYRKVTQRVEWCSDGRTITSFSVQEWPDSGPYCTPSWGSRSFSVDGGVGSSSVTILSKGAFKCDVPWPDPTFWVEVDVRYHADGRREDV